MSWSSLGSNSLAGFGRAPAYHVKSEENCEPGLPPLTAKLPILIVPLAPSHRGSIISSGSDIIMGSKTGGFVSMSNGIVNSQS